MDEIRPLTKKWHGSAEGRKWHSEHGKEGWENRQYTVLNCQFCGREYKTLTPKISKFCHLNCRAANRRSIQQGFKAGIPKYKNAGV